MGGRAPDRRAAGNVTGSEREREMEGPPGLSEGLAHLQQFILAET